MVVIVMVFRFLRVRCPRSLIAFSYSHKDCIEGLLRPGARGYWSRAASAIKSYEMLCGAGRLTNVNSRLYARGYGEFKRFPIFKRSVTFEI